MSTNIIDSSKKRGRLVWDLPTRLFHWLFVLTICAQYFTAMSGGDWMVWHFRLGYLMIALLIFRVVWGFVGPTHARFGNFVKGPGVVLAYMKRVHKVGEDAIRSVGHNPMGGLMVLVMLALVTAQALTGLFSTDDTSVFGPYYSVVSSELAETLTSAHHALFNFIIGAAVLHLVAIAFYTLVKKDRLVPAMIHGRKPALHVPAAEGIEHSALIRAAVIAVVAAAAVFVLQYGAPTSPDSGVKRSDIETEE
jgi:cytochrome b